MIRVLIAARLIAQMMGVSFDTEFACWHSSAAFSPRDATRYECRYDGDQGAIRVYVDWNDNIVHVAR